MKRLNMSRLKKNIARTETDVDGIGMNMKGDFNNVYHHGGKDMYKDQKNNHLINKDTDNVNYNGLKREEHTTSKDLLKKYRDATPKISSNKHNFRMEIND